MSQSLSSWVMPVPMAAANVPTQSFILALPGCPEGNNGTCAMPKQVPEPRDCRPVATRRECILTPPHIHPCLADACFNYNRRTWHSVMITLMKPETTLYYVRKQVGLSHLSHVPRNFCFLFKGHALDPSVEDKMRAMKIAVHNEVRVDPQPTPSRPCTTPHALMHALPRTMALDVPKRQRPPPPPPPTPPPQDQYMLFIDTTHCGLVPDETTNKEVVVIGAVVCIIVGLVAFRIGVSHKKKKRGYEQVSIEDESVERTSLCRVTKMCKKKLSPKAGVQGKSSDDAASDDATFSKSFSTSMAQKEIHL